MTTTQATYDPRAYLTEYFLDINEEYDGLYRFWCAAVGRVRPRAGEPLRALELGVGPAIYSTIPLARRFDEIHVGDYVPASLVEIDRWRQGRPGSFDWTGHIARVLQAEGADPTPAAIAEREARLRAAITRLLPCDLRAENPAPGGLASYDLVSAHYCTEAATTSLEEWDAVVGHACGLLAPGGSLLLSVATDLRIVRTYGDYAPTRPSPRVTADHARARLLALGMDPRTLHLELLPAPGDRPYAATVLVHAVRAGE